MSVCSSADLQDLPRNHPQHQKACKHHITSLAMSAQHCVFSSNVSYELLPLWVMLLKQLKLQLLCYCYGNQLAKTVNCSLLCLQDKKALVSRSLILFFFCFFYLSNNQCISTYRITAIPHANRQLVAHSSCLSLKE